MFGNFNKFKLQQNKKNVISTKWVFMTECISLSFSFVAVFTKITCSAITL